MAEFEGQRTQDNAEDSGLFDSKKIWTLFYLNWYWVLLSVFICLFISFVYLKFKSPVYAASMKILVKDADKKSRAFQGMGMALGNMGLMSSSDGFDNELEVLRSTSLSTDVVERLKLNVRYSLEGSIKNIELYKNCPISVELEKNCLDTLSIPLSLEISMTEKGFHVDGFFNVREPDEVSYSEDFTSFPAKMATSYGLLTFNQNTEFETLQAKLDAGKVINGLKKGKLLYVKVYSPRVMGRFYANKVLKASATAKTTTVAEVRFSDTKKARALDYLNELFYCYNETANEDKNEIANKTEEFISERLEKIKEELDATEGEIEVFKRDNDLVNLANDATTVLKASSDYQKDLFESQTQHVVLKSLMEYMDIPENYLQVIPANLGLENSPLITPLVSMIAEYNRKVLTRNRYLKGSGEENPLVLQLTREITDMWPSIRQNMANICRNVELKRNAVEAEYENIARRISKTPTQERVLTNIMRQQTLQSEIYLKLLQKREENFIQLYSVATKGRVIDEPVILGKVSPRTSMVLILGLVLGIVIPMALIMLRDLLRFRIEGRKDVESLTNLPILADIPVSNELDKKSDERAVIVQENRNDVVEEAFRGLRTNINFVLKPGEKVIMTTSCIPGEGKTFVAANLAMSLALLEKKVIVVGLDVRKPRLVGLFGLKPTKKGIVNFLCGAEPDYALLEDQVVPSEIHKNLDVMPAGIIPPNPAELLSGQLLGLAIKHLCSLYDYVLLDTPPVALVADTLTIGRHANMTVFVSRVDHSPKANFKLINNIVANDKLPNCNIVINGVDMKKRRHTYQYGNCGSGYGHYGLYGNYGSGTDSGKYHVEK